MVAQTSPNKGQNSIRKNTSLTSISDSIAAMFLKEAMKKECGLEIPSLGIKIEGIQRKNNNKE